VNAAVHLSYAMSYARSTIGNAMATAESTERAIRSGDPGLPDLLGSVISRAYALADVARDVERDLAAVHEQIRNNR
jgi:hypothetical protein